MHTATTQRPQNTTTRARRHAPTVIQVEEMEGKWVCLKVEEPVVAGIE